MFRSLADKLAPKKPQDHARAYERHEKEACVLKIGNQLYPVRDWSEGGVFITADAKMFGLNDEKECLLQFRLPGKIEKIPVHGKVVRKTGQGIALQFENISNEAQEQFAGLLTG